ncbi:MAG: prolyl oligopeptidase family serine peptidase [Oscillospiraceae bacterium]|nr:prolyl oligopeptidase family serine peptidase [Oscillospiraceae bacterium]
MPKPTALLLAYPAIKFDDLGDSPVTKAFVKTALGRRDQAEKKSMYNILNHVGPNYPPCYIVCCRDDRTVPCRHAEALAEKLRESGVSAELEIGEHGGHGFGNGLGTDAENWIIRALRFAEGFVGKNA